MTDTDWFSHGAIDGLEDALDLELRYLRSRPLAFSAADMMHTPLLLQHLGAGDPAKAYGALREVFGSVVFNNIDVEAARDHMYWPLNDANSAGRLKAVADRLAIDPRNAVQYSNRGVRLIAKKIVALVFDADADGYTQYGLGVFPASSGRYKVVLRARTWGRQQPQKPLNVRLNRSPVGLKDGKLTSDTPMETTLEWVLQRKLPDPAKFEQGERALTWWFGFPKYGPPRLMFADELQSRSFSVRFRTFSGLAYMELLRR